ncbi:MAG TPA: type II toxin-antitoxin system prevent-host-death family antitoxin [Mycobacteriales bacterium]|nr:type II toxin-antitoxin system prevent-host-death family antitoxin [Mycobacteriales bacterium]
MADMLSLTQAEGRLGELVSRARYEHERVLLSDGGTPVAAIISIADLEEMQQAQDAADLALCQAIKANFTGPGIPHEEVMAMLEAEDATGR